jgi:hypothetical protein
MEVIDEKVKAFVTDLLQHHLVNIRVFITKTEEGLAKTYDHGGGDWYSVYGSVREWLIKQDERSKISVHQEASEPEETA